MGVMPSPVSLPVTRWVFAEAPPAQLVGALAAELGLPLPLAALLVQRGFDTPAVARRFLRPGMEQLSDPAALAGMADAVDAVARVARAGGTILVHGDYDVDGQCAAALLTRVLRLSPARVVPFVPHRLRDGYDFGAAGLAAARAAGASLIITCDCGITAVEAVRQATEAGIGVVVTDHHLPGPLLPPALAVVDPQRPDDRSGAQGLCGTGVAFKLAQALVPVLGLPENLPYHLLDIVALATVADLVPLTGENRALVRMGLRLLNRSRWPGVRALIEVAGLAGREIRAGHLGFLLGPRLNAAGRVGDAGDGLRLLLCDDVPQAQELARQLDRLNEERQRLDQRMLEEVLERIERESGDHTRAVVLAGDGWHPGVVGIVASRVVERFGRPTFLVAFDGNVGRGSGRSISRFDLHAALHACGDLLERYGGHHMAAGLTIRRDRFDDFRRRFAGEAARLLADEDLGPEQRVDLVLPLADATADLERLCRHLEPCGMGNPAPVFGVQGVRLAGRRRVGNGHLKGTLIDGPSRLEVIGFSWADRVGSLEDGPVDIAFRLETNEWQGRVSLQARVISLLASA